MKIKRIISIMVVAVMMLSAVIPVSASETMAKTRLRNNYSDASSFFMIVGPQPFYSYDSYNRLSICMDKAKSLIDDFYSTDEELEACNEELLATMKQMYVARQWALQEYDLCVEEQNIDNWYTEDMWLEYQLELDKFKEALDAYDEKQIDTEYFAVQTLYNKLCAAYQVVGDVDKNGTVDINDVTMVQKYLSGEITFTGGQIYAAAAGCDYDGVSVECITQIQRYTASQTEKLTTFAFHGTYEYSNLIINPTRPISGEPKSVKRHL